MLLQVKINSYMKAYGFQLTFENEHVFSFLLLHNLLLPLLHNLRLRVLLHSHHHLLHSRQLRHHPLRSDTNSALIK